MIVVRSIDSGDVTRRRRACLGPNPKLGVGMELAPRKPERLMSCQGLAVGVGHADHRFLDHEARIGIADGEDQAVVVAAAEWILLVGPADATDLVWNSYITLLDRDRRPLVRSS